MHNSRTATPQLHLLTKSDNPVACSYSRTGTDGTATAMTRPRMPSTNTHLAVQKRFVYKNTTRGTETSCIQLYNVYTYTSRDEKGAGGPRAHETVSGREA